MRYDFVMLFFNEKNHKLEHEIRDEGYIEARTESDALDCALHIACRDFREETVTYSYLGKKDVLRHEIPVKEWYWLQIESQGVYDLIVYAEKTEE